MRENPRSRDKNNPGAVAGVRETVWKPLTNAPNAGWFLQANKPPGPMKTALRILLAAVAIMLALGGIYAFMLGGNFVYLGLGAYVLAWLLYFFRPRKS